MFLFCTSAQWSKETVTTKNAIYIDIFNSSVLKASGYFYRMFRD